MGVTAWFSACVPGFNYYASYSFTMADQVAPTLLLRLLFKYYAISACGVTVLLSRCVRGLRFGIERRLGGYGGGWQDRAAVGFGFWVSGFRFWGSGFGFRVGADLVKQHRSERLRSHTVRDQLTARKPPKPETYCRHIHPTAALSCQPPPYPANRRPIHSTAALSCQMPPYQPNRRLILQTAALSTQPLPYPNPQTPHAAAQKHRHPPE